MTIVWIARRLVQLQLRLANYKIGFVITESKMVIEMTSRRNAGYLRCNEMIFMVVKTTRFVMQPIPIARKQDTLRIEQCILLCEL